MRFFRKGSGGSSEEAPLQQGLFRRLGDALRRTRGAIAGGIARIIGTRTTIDDALIEDVETILLGADVGVEATRRMSSSRSRF